MSSGKSVTIGGVVFGGGAPVRVESMLKTPLADTENCLRELAGLKQAGCELVRVAFPNAELDEELKSVVKNSPIPIMADIHFNHKLALKAIECGCSSIRINPGNMGSREGLMEVLAESRSNRVVIRIGSNGGSISRKQLDAQDGDRARALVYAVEEQLIPLIDSGFEDIIISAKSSSVMDTVRANAILSQRYPLPLHIGITEAGFGIDGAVKSAAGLGILLAQGIGDTMRVSLTGDAVEEVRVAYSIQRSLGLRHRGVNLISCPGCGRRRIDVASLVDRVTALIPDDVPDGLSVAVMGCEVNGPKEAASADMGIAGTQGGFVMFRAGEVVASGCTEEMEGALKRYFNEIKNNLDDI